MLTTMVLQFHPHFSLWGNGSSETQSNLPKITQLVKGRSRAEAQVCHQTAFYLGPGHPEPYAQRETVPVCQEAAGEH